MQKAFKRKLLTMSEDFFYSEIAKAKDGNLIPLCKNKATGQEISLHSKYNPLREAEGFAQNIDETGLFFLVLGIAGGYHIEKLLEKAPKAKVLALEVSEEAVTFLENLPYVKKLMQKKNFSFCTPESIEKKLLSMYKPALHGNLSILSLRQWESIFQKTAAEAKEKITATIKLLAQDYSVQCHFGKIWQKNILENLSLAENAISFEKVLESVKGMVKEKTAAIIAAGPSLDKSIKTLRDKRKEYFIISTDTAFHSLLKQGIESDAVISIDAQQVSHEHYMRNLPEKTLYVFDLCASPSSARKALSKTKNVIFSESSHPLAQYASLFTGKRAFVHLDAGSGTVTIAALSLAKKLGFSKIEFFGADFSYIEGRPYARGTYLEQSFHSKSGRLSPAEKSYTALMFRTPTIKISDKKITTEILEAYKSSLEDFMQKFDKKEADEEKFPYGTFSLKDFKLRYCKDLRNSFRSEDDFDEDSNATTTLLPLCAKIGKGKAFIAYLKTLRYTERV